MTNQPDAQGPATEPAHGTGAMKYLVIAAVCLIVSILAGQVQGDAGTKGGVLFLGMVSAFGTLGFLVTLIMGIVVFFKNRKRRTA